MSNQTEKITAEFKSAEMDGQIIINSRFVQNRLKIFKKQ